ncbi:MAG: HlyD family efflux transporter periplasmic adaptor subunit, partial [Bacteroidota bacterium]
GSLQKSYATLLQKLKDYNFFNRQTEAAARIASLENQKSYISKLNTEIEKQEGTLEQEVEIALGNYQRDQQLQKEGLLAEVALKKSETEYLQYQRQLENLRTQYINNNIRIEELQSQIIGIRELRSSGLSIRQLTLEEDLDRIQGDIDDWKLQYLITAPIAGSVSLADIWSPQQFVRANEEIMAIVPRSGSGKVIGKAILPIANSGKVRIGQDANILLDGFPFQEFGVIPSKVKSISLIPQKDNYLVAIELPDSLRTTYDVEIPFRQEMSGTVNIITENRRILERVLDRLLSIVKNS